MACRSSVLALLIIATTLACGDDTDPPDHSPHACLGASLRAELLCDLDGDSLAAAIEAALPALTCAHRVIPGFVECIPLDDPDGCGFDDRDSAETLEADFRAALAAFDACYDDYAFEVIDECYCRAY